MLRNELIEQAGKQDKAGEETDPGIYLFDQDPKTIAENKKILAELEMYTLGRRQDVVDVQSWTNRLRKEGMGR